MRRYETIFILRPNIGEEEITRVIDYATGIIKSDGGTIIELNRWGVKKLAYLIKKESLGYYVFCDYASVPASVSEIERRFRIDDAVMKYMTIKTADSVDDESIQQAIVEATEKAAAEEAAAKEAAEAAADTESGNDSDEQTENDDNTAEAE